MMLIRKSFIIFCSFFCLQSLMAIPVPEEKKTDFPSKFSEPYFSSNTNDWQMDLLYKDEVAVRGAYFEQNKIFCDPQKDPVIKRLKEISPYDFYNVCKLC